MSDDDDMVLDLAQGKTQQQQQPLPEIDWSTMVAQKENRARTALNLVKVMHPVKAKDMSIYGLLRCENKGSGRVWDRDVNASRNMRHVFLSRDASPRSTAVSSDFP